ncbi:MAG: FliJ family protein [Aquificae bacterium]|nr:FliJ family protein [Aquificota bacterium]
MRGLDEVLTTLYEFYQKVDSAFLQRKVGNYTVKSLLFGAVKYSFVVWLGIAAWVGYRYYQEVEKLNQTIERKKSLLQSKKRQVALLEKKVEDLKEAYRTVKETFKEEEVERLKRRVDEAFVRAFSAGRLSSPVRYEVFNVKLNLPRGAVKLPAVRLPTAAVDSAAVKYFETALTRKVQDLLNEPEPRSGTVRVAAKGNKLFLYFEPGEGGFSLVPTVYTGFVKGVFSGSDFLTATYLPFEAIKEKKEFTNLLVGWTVNLVNKEDEK